jgi:hypothetical protein
MRYAALAFDMHQQGCCVAQQKAVVRAIEDVMLMDVKTYILTKLLTLRHRFAVSHGGLPFEIGFDNLRDAETFFTVEVQRTRQASTFTRTV